jgi:tripartite ATP-independent transporter DctM subunit
MLVIMADQLNLSVGDLFMGAVIPGVILGVLYMVYILLIGLVRPKHAPLPDHREKISPKVFLEVLKTVLPPLGLIVLVLGSIFAGVATPTEASGVGALGAIVLVWYNKKLSFKVFKEVNKATFQTCSYIFGIFFGAQAFALVLRMLGGDEFIKRLLLSLPFGPMGVIAFIIALVFLMGFFLDWIEISLIFLPLLAPVLPGLGLEVNGYGVIEKPELVWFAVLVAVTLQTSFLTPPVGFTIFFLQGVAPEGVVLLDIYKGVIAFVGLQVLGFLLVFVWPELVTWLPALAYGY